MARSVTSNLVHRVQAAALNAPPMLPVDPGRNEDVHTQMWSGPGAEFPRRGGGYTPPDDQLFLVGSNEHGPESVDGQVPLWVTASCPGWNCPSFWSKPFSETYQICLPTWETEFTLGILTAGEMDMRIIKSVSYHIESGLSQYDLFEMKMYESGMLRATWEDMIIDPTTADPSHQYVFAGHTKPLELWQRIDRNRKARFTVKARGLVDLAGVSNHAPGDPIVPDACNFTLVVNGWVAPIRQNNDGAPRVGDLGNQLFVDMDPDLYLEGM